MQKARPASGQLPCGQGRIVGTAILGERGQLVIPKELRELYGLKAGDSFLAMGHDDKGTIVLIPVKQMKQFIKQIQNDIDLAMKK